MTVATALPVLLKLQRKRNTLRQALGCAGKARLHAPAKTEIPDLDWSHCPLDLINDPRIVAVFHLSRMANVAPLSDWPAGYAAWVVAGIMALRGAS